jgi:uncharacterized protein (TIGR00255 family)
MHMHSMTGFGSKVAEFSHFGKISVELRSTNHKFLEIVFHLPEGFLSLEDKIKKQIEGKIKRGRVICSINIAGGKSSDVHINKELLKKYLATLKNIKRQFGVHDDVSLNTLIHLPGILSLGENKIVGEGIWPGLKTLVNGAIDGLVTTRKKEGKSLYGHLKNRTEASQDSLDYIKKRFKKAINDKLSKLDTDEEKAGFLKDTDIAEEIERLDFHLQNFKDKLLKSGPIGKELDFIAQEMQREANTMAAKSFDIAVSARVVQVKSQIEKIREQVQNIE